MSKAKRTGQLGADEQELLEAYEKGDFKSVPNRDREIERYRKYAEVTFRKDKRINIRLSSRDLNVIQKRALEEGLPYQTLIASILHQYASGTLGSNQADYVREARKKYASDPKR